MEALYDDEAAPGGEGRVGKGEGRHLPDWSAGASSEGGWGGRVMENIGDASDEEAEGYQAKAKHRHRHRASHGERPDPPTRTAEFEGYSYPYPQREIRELQITTLLNTIASPLAPALPLDRHAFELGPRPA